MHEMGRCACAGLLCLKQAEWGGLSSWASSVAVHNAMLERHPDLAAVMAEPWYIDRKNEVPKGKLPYFAMPLFNYHQVRSCKRLCMLRDQAGT